MEKIRRVLLSALLGVTAAATFGGCMLKTQHEVKTQHEIKPIHITMDVNIKVQKELEDFLILD
jgi:hypothetical protein